MRASLSILISVVYITAASSAGRAQTVGGQVLAIGTRKPIANVRVILADAKGRHSDSTSTDSSGTFYLTAPKPGEYAFRFAQRQLWFDNSPSFSVQAGQFHQGSYLIPDHSVDRVSTADGVEQPAIPMAGNPAPRYPSSLRQRGVQGAALVRFIINTDGDVAAGSASVVSSNRPEFGAAVLDVLYRLRFRPGLVQGQAVPVMICMPSTFRLTGASGEVDADRALDSLIASWPRKDLCPF